MTTQKPVCIKYDVIGHVALIDSDKLERMFKRLARLGVKAEIKVNGSPRVERNKSAK